MKYHKAFEKYWKRSHRSLSSEYTKRAAYSAWQAGIRFQKLRTTGVPVYSRYTMN